jgi:hypothetical protein
VPALLGEDAPSIGRHLVEPPAAFGGLLDPDALDPAALLEAVEQGVDGIEVKLQPPVRPCLDQLAQLVAMPEPRVAVIRPSSVVVGATTLRGDGWTATVGPGWTVQPVPPPGSFRVVRQ